MNFILNVSNRFNLWNSVALKMYKVKLILLMEQPSILVVFAE